jgi:hypothetical protein
LIIEYREREREREPYKAISTSLPSPKEEDVCAMKREGRGASVLGAKRRREPEHQGPGEHEREGANGRVPNRSKVKGRF